MGITFEKKCIKKAITYLENLNNHASYAIIYDLKRIDKELNNPFSNIYNKGYFDAELREKYFYINDFEKTINDYSFLLQEQIKINRFSLEYWDKRLKIDYYAIIGYILKKYNLINSLEEYLKKDKSVET